MTTETDTTGAKSVDAPEGAPGYVLGPDDGERIDSLGLRILATGTQTRESLLAAVVTNPGPGGPPVHTHDEMDELYLVIRGRYRFKIGDAMHEGGPGTFAFVPRGTSHSFASVGPEQGEMFFITLPTSEEFLRGMSDLSVRGADQREMVEHFRAFQSKLDGPPLI